MQRIRPDLDIGANIQKIRKSTGLTQLEVIAKLHLMGLEMTQSTYSKLETNRMNIRVSELVALSQIFGVDYNAFFAELLLPSL